MPRTDPDIDQLKLVYASVAKLNDLVMITEAGPADPSNPKIVYLNDAFEILTGYSRADVMGKSPRLLLGMASQLTELIRIREAIEQLLPVRAELIIYRKDGSLLWVDLDAMPVKQDTQKIQHWITVARVINKRKVAEKIEYLAFYDPLTRLPNRHLLMDRLELALSGNQNSDEGVNTPASGALMFIDLDNFKVLNDTLGHATGDLLLRKVAIRLSACVRLRDTVARLGGDEFVVMLENLPADLALATEYSRKVGEKILLSLSEPYDLMSAQHDSTCSIGITLFGKRQQNVSDVLKQADLAMYQAKTDGRNSLRFFDPAMQAVVNANAAINSELRQSLRRGDFVIHYQPQVGRDSKMFGVEALIRWQHPERGLVHPNEFITQAEESGLILPLGKWVLETACDQLASWALREETRHLTVSVNVSVRQFRQPEFVELVMMTINNLGVNASKLKLELTESLLATGMDVTIAKMGMLKDIGVTLSIDDFGIGYSSLSHLKHLPLDQLKIDRTFVRDILTDPNDAAIARTIIGLAQSLGLDVMAEGVETEAQRALLDRFGCGCYQGHLFCKALPIDELEVFMHEHDIAISQAASL